MNPLEELRSEYRAGLPDKVAHLRALLAAGNLKELQRALHTLAGSAGTFGLRALGQAALAAEESLADGKTERLAALIDAIAGVASKPP